MCASIAPTPYGDASHETTIGFCGSIVELHIALFSMQKMQLPAPDPTAIFGPFAEEHEVVQ